MMICPACQASTSRSNLARHRLHPRHIAAVALSGDDPSIRSRGQPAAVDAVFAERFWSNVDRSGGPDACWPWMRARQTSGYGKVYRGGRLLVASRVALELTLERMLPRAVFARHVVCDNPPCCNPAHLAEGTVQENLADLSAKGLMPVGTARPNVKLDEASVHVIRDAAGTASVEAIGARFGVSASPACPFIARKKWRHVA